MSDVTPQRPTDLPSFSVPAVAVTVTRAPLPTKESLAFFSGIGLLFFFVASKNLRLSIVAVAIALLIRPLLKFLFVKRRLCKAVEVSGDRLTLRCDGGDVVLLRRDAALVMVSPRHSGLDLKLRDGRELSIALDADSYEGRDGLALEILEAWGEQGAYSSVYSHPEWIARSITMVVIGVVLGLMLSLPVSGLIAHLTTATGSVDGTLWFRSFALTCVVVCVLLLELTWIRDVVVDASGLTLRTKLRRTHFPWHTLTHVILEGSALVVCPEFGEPQRFRFTTFAADPSLWPPFALQVNAREKRSLVDLRLTGATREDSQGS